MIELRILIVEDDDGWQSDIAEKLEPLAPVKLCSAKSFKKALECIRRHAYDLAVVDLSLPDAPDSKEQESGEQGMELLGVIRGDKLNADCGLIVLTAWATHDRINEGYAKYHIDYFLEKQNIGEIDFIEIAQEAIMKSRLRRAAARKKESYYLNISFDDQQLLGTEIIGPTRHAIYRPNEPSPFEVTELAGRADRLNQTIIKSGAEGWRPEASSIGQAIYDVLSSDRRVFADLLMARTLPIHAKDLRLQFTGPAVGLGIPFELLRTGRDNLALKHVLTRRVIQEGDSYTHRLESFRAFIEERWKAKAPLRVLIVGSNSDGKIPAAEIEADTLATAINDDLKRMGITPEITALTGERATYNEVCSALSDGRFHIFHYAGHGRFDDQLPEISGLILKDGSGGRELTANVLEQLLSDTELRLVYLSCCLGARTSSQLGRGDFYGLLDSIIRADVPVALGHRWTIADDPAKLIALFFYQELWRTFSPGEALLQARKRISSELGRDDETWASPIIVMQNAYEEMETAP